MPFADLDIEAYDSFIIVELNEYIINYFYKSHVVE